MLPIGNVNASVKYSRKTSRPAFEQLSSSIKYIDRYNYERGNPNLQPVYRDYVSVSAYWKNLAVELDYSSTKNYFMWQTVEYSDNQDVAMLTMQNMPRYGSWRPCLIIHHRWDAGIQRSWQASCGKILSWNTMAVS